MASSVRNASVDRDARSFHDLPSGGMDLSPWRQFTTAVRLFYRNYFRTRGEPLGLSFGGWFCFRHSLLVPGLWLAVCCQSVGRISLPMTPRNFSRKR